MSEWVNVKDRLPDEGGNYLVTSNSGEPFISQFYKDRLEFGFPTPAFNLWFPKGVIYWMPLPEPPKED